jgi:molybdopterin-containing oxidoreductase family membrane subunit
MEKSAGFSKIWLLALAIVVGIGLFSAGLSQVKGQVVFGSTDQVPWNILIAAYVFLALTASGLCLVSTFGHVLGLERYQLIGKRSLFLAIAVLIPALAVLTMDLGRIDRLFYFFISPNFSSPMWWMGTVYGIYLLFLIIEFLAVHKGNHQRVKLVSIFTLVGAVSATSILGGIFAVAAIRPLWYGGATPIYFVLSALVSGVAVLLFTTVMTYQLSGKVMDEKLKSILKELGKVLSVMLAVALGFNVWRLVIVYYVGAGDFGLIIGGPFSLAFWVGQILIGLIIPFYLMVSPVRRTENNLKLAGFMVLAGMFADKYIMVIAGQLIQPFGKPVATYTSTFAEWSIIGGAIAATILIYIYAHKRWALD